ncbi:acid phosphatase-domain-containing protein [Favolaschia claudopus]|uniref:Acid phosphatase-domain-containing protein n=1 Tax=Favolaschia claudopus TaxID=2862362 RepID=A0AAW0A4A9_9AGAR
MAQKFSVPESVYPKLVGLDLDYTLWEGWLDDKKFGRGWQTIEDCLERSGNVLKDKSDDRNFVTLFPEVEKIISDLAMNNVQIALVSRNTNRALCDRALWHFQATDPKTHKRKGIIFFAKYSEIYRESKTQHFKRIQEWSGFQYSDMILFDDEAENNVVERELGVTFKVLRDSAGLTWTRYKEGLALWRRNKYFSRCRPHPDRHLCPKPKFIGWVGTDAKTMERYRRGQRRLDYTRPARYGYGLYLSDDPAIAMYFAGWGGNGQTNRQRGDMYVCAIYARDGNLFDQIPKFWVSESGPYQTDNMHQTKAAVAWAQEDRDQRIERLYGKLKPYILLSKHHTMTAFGMGGITSGNRFNEMVIYPQLQDALFYAGRAWRVEQFANASDRPERVSFASFVGNGSIDIPLETYSDLRQHGEV